MKVVATELLKRFVMSARGTLLGFLLLRFFFLKDVGTTGGILFLLPFCGGGTFSLSPWSEVVAVVAVPLPPASIICDGFGGDRKEELVLLLLFKDRDVVEEVGDDVFVGCVVMIYIHC